MSIKRQIIRIKSDVDEVIIEFTDPTGGIVEHTIFIENAQGLRDGKFAASGYAGRIDAEKLKRLHFQMESERVGCGIAHRPQGAQ